MQIPEKVSLEEFDEAIENFKNEECENSYGNDENLQCKDCALDITYAFCRISIHDGSECAGTGDAISRMVPYCPGCEEMPETISTCVHREFEEFFTVSKEFTFGFRVPSKIVILSLFIGGGIGALIMYLVLSLVFHR